MQEEKGEDKMLMNNGGLLMDYERIKEMDGYEGDRNGFIELNNAIWGKAVEDELKHQKARLFQDITEKVFTCLLKFDKEKRNTYAKVESIITERYRIPGLKLVKQLESTIEEFHDNLKKSVQNKVYRESLEWPDNIKNKKDLEYEKEYRQIRDNVLKSTNSFKEA